MSMWTHNFPLLQNPDPVVGRKLLAELHKQIQTTQQLKGHDQLVRSLDPQLKSREVHTSTYV